MSSGLNHLRSSPAVIEAKARHAALSGDVGVIPKGTYCHGLLTPLPRPVGIPQVTGPVCPYWAFVEDGPEQMNGYCALLDRGDWEDGGLLWDQCKECGINDPEEDYLPEPDIAMIMALHRGFREQCRWEGGTDFTSWESPLPNLTWSHLPIDKIKALLDQGGFDWEVAAALKRKAKGQHLDEE